VKLLLDIGNSNIKSARLEGDIWQSDTQQSLAQHAEFIAQIQALDNLDAIWMSNVAGVAISQLLQSSFAAKPIKINLIRARPQQCGVINHYQHPAQLGSDRWCALIGAWTQFKRAALVVNCGTATTIDTLSAKGEFLGGLILPGVALMQSCLAARTAQLAHGAGGYQIFPCNTADAMASGALQATLGAMARQRQNLGDTLLILTGGAAPLVAAQLDEKFELIENLVLQGIAQIAQERV
jgi:type III pantothenate kinase